MYVNYSNYSYLVQLFQLLYIILAEEVILVDSVDNVFGCCVVVGCG